MKSNKKWIKSILIAAGMVEIVAGLLHFFILQFAFQSDGFSFLQPKELDFVTSGVFAVGILLIAFGSLTVIFSFIVEAGKEVLFYYVVVKSILWLGRIAIEVLYPVKLNILNADPFTTVLMPGLIAEFLLFLALVVLVKKYLNADRVI